MSRACFTLALFSILLAAPGCSPRQAPTAATAHIGVYEDFGPPQVVVIRDYDGDAMKPFITPDGRFLLFNNRVDPREDTQLLIAERIDDLTYHGLGEMVGVNSPSLDVSASLDRDNHLYFISGRSYDQSYSMVYRGQFADGVVNQVELVPGVSEHRPGHLTFDASISADGNTLLLVDGRLGPGDLPGQAEIGMALREGGRFRRLAPETGPFAAVNAPGTLNYAPALSADGLELFFTRLVPAERSPQPMILRAARNSPQEAFGPPQRVAAIDGYAESPALSPDGRALYYTKREKARFAIFRVTRR